MFVYPKKNNHGSTVPCANNNVSEQVQFVSDHCNIKNTTTNMTHQKLPLYGKDYICFQTYVITYQAAQFSKSRNLIKDVESILYIGSFQQ